MRTKEWKSLSTVEAMREAGETAILANLSLVMDTLDLAEQFRPASPALDQAFTKLKDAFPDKERRLYEEAIREWVARRLRGRGHTEFTRDRIRNVRFGIAEGWPGTDVTPGDEDYAALTCEILDGKKWKEHQENIEYVSPVEVVQQCLAIYAELNTAARS